jgi:hypothetical protein
MSQSPVVAALLPSGSLTRDSQGPFILAAKLIMPNGISDARFQIPAALDRESRIENRESTIVCPFMLFRYEIPREKRAENVYYHWIWIFLLFNRQE